MKYPRVGIGVFVIKDGKILLGKRKSQNGFGTWGLPGGKLEMYEDIRECAIRETLEETGLVVKLIDEFVFNGTYSKNAEEHWVTLFYIGLLAYENQSVRIAEPDKFFSWNWFYLDELKNRPDLFTPLKSFFSNDGYVERLNKYVKIYGFGE